MSKKLSALFLILAMFFVSQTVVGAEEKKIITSSGIKMTQKEYNNLKELGFTDLAIDQMPLEVFKQNKDLKILAKGENTKYYEVKEVFEDGEIKDRIQTELTEDEYFKRVKDAKNHKQSNANTFSIAANPDTTSTSYRRLTTTITRLSTSTIRLHSKFVWDIMPETRSYDVLSTSIDSTFTPVSGSNYGQQLWSYTHPVYGGFYGDNATYSSSSTAWSKQSAGYGVKMNLKDDETNMRIVELEGYAYFNITRSSSVVPYYINAYGNYSHAKTTVSSSFSYGLDFGGPSISWSGVSSTSFDSITTHAQVRY